MSHVESVLKEFQKIDGGTLEPFAPLYTGRGRVYSTDGDETFNIEVRGLTKAQVESIIRLL